MAEVPKLEQLEKLEWNQSSLDVERFCIYSGPWLDTVECSTNVTRAIHRHSMKWKTLLEC